MNTPHTIVDEAAVTEFLSGKRFALIGASRNPKHFSASVATGFTDHGYDIVRVNRHGDVASVADITGPVDGAVIMLTGDAALDALRECTDAGITRIWLFKGIGSPGATSPAATEWCERHGITVVDGACPPMYLQPTGAIHRFHRGIRRWRGHLQPVTTTPST
jgi:predicted CoA-binding protein